MADSRIDQLRAFQSDVTPRTGESLNHQFQLRSPAVGNRRLEFPEAHLGPGSAIDSDDQVARAKPGEFGRRAGQGEQHPASIQGRLEDNADAAIVPRGVALERCDLIGVVVARIAVQTLDQSMKRGVGQFPTAHVAHEVGANPIAHLTVVRHVGVLAPLPEKRTADCQRQAASQAPPKARSMGVQAEKGRAWRILCWKVGLSRMAAQNSRERRFPLRLLAVHRSTACGTSQLDAGGGTGTSTMQSCGAVPWDCGLLSRSPGLNCVQERTPTPLDPRDQVPKLRPPRSLDFCSYPANLARDSLARVGSYWSPRGPTVEIRPAPSDTIRTLLTSKQTTMRPIRILSLLLVLAAVPASAQVAPTAPGAARKPAAPTPQAALTLPQVREVFAKSDADHSGGLNSIESLAAGLEAAGFTAADLDLDQQLSTDEFIVASESRASKQAAGVASDLVAESTRLQALRRAQKSEDLKLRREAATPAAPASARGATREPAATPAPGAEAAPAPAAVGPAAARRALATETAPDREKRLQEIRDSIARRLRNGELTPEQAQEAYATLDRRISNALGDAPKATPAQPSGTASTGEVDLRALEESLNRRLRNSELDAAKAQEIYNDLSRRVENAKLGGEPVATPAVGASELGVAGSPLQTAGAGPQATPSLRDKVIEAQDDLTRRMRNAELTPEQAAAERAAVSLRSQHAVEKAKSLDGEHSAGASGAPAVAEPEPQPARVRGANPPIAPPTDTTPRRPATPGAVAPNAPNTPPTGGVRAAGSPAAAGTPSAQPAPARAADPTEKPVPPAARPAATDKQAPATPVPARPAPKPVTPPAGGGAANGS